MKKTIWKYPINPTTEYIKVPVGAKILSAHGQHDNPTIWALVDEDVKEMIPIGVRVYPTGGNFNLPGGYEFLGTCLLHNGQLVFHVFVERKDTLHDND